MKPALRFLALAAAAGLLAACSGGNRVNVLVPDGSASFALMDFSQPLPLDPVPAGWYHRKFFRTSPMDISLVKKDGRASIRLATHGSGSMLYRYVDVDLDSYPTLGWDWFIEQPITSDADEMTIAGDDHPARIYMQFLSAGGEAHSMEIIWGNRKLRSGDWKYLTFSGKPFPHYVANGGNDNIGRWHHQRVELGKLYREQWGEPRGARLVEIALFSDTDQTGAQSIAYFSDIRIGKSRQDRPQQGP